MLTAKLSLIDGGVCLAYLAVVFGLALKSVKGQENNEDYFVGGRRMNWFAVGVSMFAGYTYNERSYLSLAVVNPDIEPGTEVRLVWGEEGGGSHKTTVERHRQIEMRVTVGPTPYAQPAREGYHQGWRTGSTKL